MKITKERLIEIIKEELEESFGRSRSQRIRDMRDDEGPVSVNRAFKGIKIRDVEDDDYEYPSSEPAPAPAKEKPSFFSTWLQTDIPIGYKDSEGRDLKQAKSYHKAQIYKVGPDRAFNEIDALAQAAEKAQDAVARKFGSKVKDAILDMYG